MGGDWERRKTELRENEYCLRKTAYNFISASIILLGKFFTRLKKPARLMLISFIDREIEVGSDRVSRSTVAGF